MQAPFSRPPFGAFRVRRAFTLIELLVVLLIVTLLAAVSFPMLGATVREVKVDAAMKRVTAGLQEAGAMLADHARVDRNLTVPRIPGGIDTGTALVVRWVDAQHEYEVFYAVSNQTASGAGGPADYLCARPTPIRGYSPLHAFEPITLGNGIKVAGLRRNDAAPSKLELLPGSSFAICVNPVGTLIPYTQSIVVNLQRAPVTGGSGPWDVWDTSPYDAPGATTGAYASTYRHSRAGDMGANAGEAFLTALPLAVFYAEEELPLTGNAPSGVPWRIADPAGVAVMNPALEVNELLKQTKGRLVFLSIQGSAVDQY